MVGVAAVDDVVAVGPVEEKCLWQSKLVVGGGCRTRIRKVWRWG